MEKPDFCNQNFSKKLKILALHGYRQNAPTFKGKTGSFRKIVNKSVEFTYVTAPHKVLLVHDISNLNAETEVNVEESRDEGKCI